MLTANEIKKAIQERNFDLLIENAVKLQAEKGTFFTVDDVKKYYGYHITQKHDAKMAGMISSSTNSLENEFCNQHKNVEDSICQDCFANDLLHMRKQLKDCLSYNSALLKHCILPVEILPALNCLYFRFESFGDLDNVNQAINYINIARKNPKTTFAIWTKNPVIMKRALKITGKPENLIIIYSSLFKNRKEDGEKMMKIYPWIDKVFTVYDAETIKRENIGINCGAKQCLSCLICYTKNEIQFVNEKLKKGGKR